MRRQIAVVMCSLVFGIMTLSSHAIAQQKTVAACREEWRANKAANQANGITLKAYVAQCRGGATPAETTAAPAAPAAPAPTAETGQKTARECREEWRANKAANQANGVTEKAYVAQCRSGASRAQPTAAPAAPAAPTPTAETGQKTIAACREEWRANKAANQANGITLKAYVAQCRGGATPAETTAAPAAPPALVLLRPLRPLPLLRRPLLRLLLQRQRQPLLSLDRLPRRLRLPDQLPAFRQVPPGQTNSQPKRRPRPAVPLTPLCGSV